MHGSLLLSECLSMYNLEDYRVVGVPDSAYIIPNFINEQEEKTLFNHIEKSPKLKWVHLSNRRLQNWGGNPSPKVRSSSN